MRVESVCNRYNMFLLIKCIYSTSSQLTTKFQCRYLLLVRQGRLGIPFIIFQGGKLYIVCIIYIDIDIDINIDIDIDMCLIYIYYMFKINTYVYIYIEIYTNSIETERNIFC